MVRILYMDKRVTASVSKRLSTSRTRRDVVWIQRRRPDEIGKDRTDYCKLSGIKEMQNSLYIKCNEFFNN